MVLGPGSHRAEAFQKKLFAVHLVSYSSLSALVLPPLDVQVEPLHGLGVELLPVILSSELSQNLILLS